jgi:hypothetical protein
VKPSALSHGIIARIVIGRFVGCYRRNLSRTMLCNVSAAVPVPIYPIAQEHSIRAAFIAHGNRAASGWSGHVVDGAERSCDQLVEP